LAGALKEKKMPYVRIETRQGWLEDRSEELFDGIDSALVDVLGVPPGDSLLRLHCYSAGMIRLPQECDDPRFVLLEVALFPGRSLNTKRALYRALTDAMAALGVPPDAVTVMLNEVALNNWGIHNGQAASDVSFDFPITV
jgi:phenylpyruvate tautomerase PptA (4-oxalocrotonate tautomerase family)